MSELSRFLKENKKKRENTTYAPSKYFVDEKGKPLEWTFRPITTKENDELRDRNSVDVPVTGKPGQFRTKLDYSGYMADLIAASVVEPNLKSAELQDSYGVKKPKDLLREMIDDPGEYNDLVQFVSDYNGFSETLADKREKAKN